jgi:poly(A) polymerase
MMHAGVVTHFLPEGTNVQALERLVALEQEQQGRAFVLRRLAALLDITRNSAPAVAKALRLSNDQAEHLSALAAPVWKVSMDMTPVEVQRLVYRIGNDMTRSLLLLAAARESRTDNLDALYHTATSFRPPRFPLIGEDVLRAGWKQGPDVGRILNDLAEWWMDSEFRPGRTECLQKLKADYPPPAA